MYSTLLALFKPSAIEAQGFLPAICLPAFLYSPTQPSAVVTHSRFTQLPTTASTPPLPSSPPPPLSSRHRAMCMITTTPWHLRVVPLPDLSHTQPPLQPPSAFCCTTKHRRSNASAHRRTWVHVQGRMHASSTSPVRERRLQAPPKLIPCAIWVNGRMHAAMSDSLPAHRM